MEKFQAEATTRSFEESENVRKVMYALISAAMLALPQKAEALEFPDGTGWYDGIQKIEETATNEDNEWSYLYLKTKESGVWISPQEHKKSTKVVRTNETLARANHVTSEKSIERVCFGHTHPAAFNTAYGPSYIDISQLPKFVNAVNELSGESSSVFSDNVSVAGMAADENGIWYYEGYDPELVARNIAEAIEPERIKLISTVADWLNETMNNTQPNATLNELQSMMLKKGYEIDKSSPEQIANTLWEMVKIAPEYNDFRVGQTFGLLMKDEIIGESVTKIIVTMSKKIADVSTSAIIELVFEIRDKMDKLDSNERVSYLQTELPRVVEAYENFYGTKVNFLTHEESKIAPPCPPIDYRPE